MTSNIEVGTVDDTIDDDDDFTPGQEKAMGVIAAIVAVASLMSAVWIWWSDNSQECLAEVYCAAVDQEWKIKLTGQHESINGLSNVYDLSAEVVLASGEIVPMAVRAYENDDWGDELEVEGIEIRGVSVTGYMDPISLRLVYTIPDLPGHVGEIATLRVNGQVLIPIIARDDVVSRTFDTEMSFDEVTRQVSDETDVLLKEESFSETPGIAKGWFWLAVILFPLSLLVAIGALADDPDEEEEGGNEEAENA